MRPPEHPTEPAWSWRVRVTRGLFVVGIVMAGVSYVTHHLYGVRELYPFFHWHMVPFPLGWGEETTVRLYAITDDDDLQRLPIEPLPTYSEVAYHYQLVRFTELLEKEGCEGLQPDLRTLGQRLAPDAAGIAFVEEVFRPHPIPIDSLSYVATPVCSAQW
ncbi:MAG: hypothetical protein AAF730_03145 [Bacteroidota bacterium]